jgi:peptidoglycan/xylan/chitin deacetylase (PgdA/CDA1 family)
MKVSKSAVQQKSSLVLCLVVFALFFAGCRKGVPEGELVEGQVALTFDDASVENWHNHLSLLDSLNIKATFYISHYHTFNKQQKAWLKDIQKHGHEIAFHTATHPDLAKEVSKIGLASTEEKEIKTDLKLMQADGYNPTDFAYPFGSHTSQLNTCLLRTFKSVRALSNQQNYNLSLVKEASEGKVLYGANIDNNSRLKEGGILSLLDKAREHHDCLVMVAHQINTNTALQITRQRLQYIAQRASERNLKFITVNEIVK